MEEKLFQELWPQIKRSYRLKTTRDIGFGQSHLRFVIREVIQSADGKGWSEQKIRQEILDNYDPHPGDDLFNLEVQTFGDEGQHKSDALYEGTDDDED